MYKHYNDYYWKSGKPYGRGEVLASENQASYKIIVDPYFKRFSIEKYCFEQFDCIIYDSVLLDFRHLTLGDQIAWRHEMLKNENGSSLAVLRNHDDRAILLESHSFEGKYCRTCQTSSLFGNRLATHRMFYKSLNDSFNGLVLYDVEQRPVMMKTYEIDPVTEEFSKLLTEEWNMQTLPFLLSSSF